jgi:hypothetical protein
MIDPLLREKLKTLEKRVCASIFGQEEVIREIVPILINGELGINSEGKPKANLLLLGPPGVGKTEICNVFTDYLLGSEKLIRFDMSEYQTVESIYREVLQLWRRDLIGWFDAPAHAFGFGSIQVAANRTGGHPAGGWLLPALLFVLSRRGGTPCRARTFGRPRHCLEVGAALSPRSSAPVAIAAPTDQRQLAGG